MSLKNILIWKYWLRLYNILTKLDKRHVYLISYNIFLLDLQPAFWLGNFLVSYIFILNLFSKIFHNNHIKTIKIILVLTWNVNIYLIKGYRGEQDGRGVAGLGGCISPWIHQEYTFRHRSACKTPTESGQEYLTTGKGYIEPCKTQ